MKVKYKVKKLDGSWSKWYDGDEKCNEKKVLAVYVSEIVTKEQFLRLINEWNNIK